MAKIIPISGSRLRLPGPSDRMVNIGTTGSGKTWAGLFHLANSTFNVRPYIIFDHKMDENLAQIDAQHIELGEVPRYPGMYICHPMPNDMDALDAHFMSIWDRGNTGIYCDEGFMCGNGDGFTACLTQGRSLKIPMIINSQRPVFMSRFVFSEASFFQAFRMNDKRDKQTVRSFIPLPDTTLPEFYSQYYDVNKNVLYRFKPVPSASASIARINKRLEVLYKTGRERRYI